MSDDARQQALEAWILAGAGIGAPAERRIDTPISAVFLYADKVLSAGEALLVSQMMSDWNITLLEVKKPVHNRASQWPPQLRRAAADACS